MENILTALADIAKPCTVTEVLTHGIEGFNGLTNQKVAALLRKLVESGKVNKAMEGKKALFSLT
jgi:hypothetical protein